MTSGRIPRLAYARLRYSSVFDSECNVLRNGVDVYGHAIPCIVGVPDDQNQQVEGQNIPVGAFLVGTPMNYPTQYGDYVNERGRQLRVIATTDPRSYQVRCEAYAIDVGPIPEPMP